MALILNGDCLEKMKGMADNSVESIVTDPPYGLAFMGKKWDYDVPSVAVWREALRVLKPGGHILAFAGSRTYHRMAVNIEDAGFEIRDQIMWIYGSGFPKSLNISKAIDKKLGAEREKIRKKYSPQQMLMKDGQNERPWQNKAKELGYHETMSDKPASPEAEQWNGWGTALKPAHEPIVLARKPVEGTVTDNVLAHGTGGLNIDESRVGNIVQDTSKNGRKAESHKATIFESGLKKDFDGEITVGRFPANVIHDGSEEVKELMPDVKGSSPAELGDTGFWFGENRSDKPMAPGYGDDGSAARFFKEASFSKQEHGRFPANIILDAEAGAILDEQGGDLKAATSRTDTISTGMFAGGDAGTVYADEGGASRFFKEADFSTEERGRFPANVIHDGSEEVLEGFPHTESGDGKPHHIVRESQSQSMSGKNYAGRSLNTYGDKGSAARFFYCAKASTAERNAGCEELQEQEMGKNQSSLEGGKMLTGSGNERSNLKKNFHPTVKPIAIMEYLCRLITPPGGVILDPFMGSGTTGIAALRLGFEFVGIELSEEYVEIATARIAHWVEMDLTFNDENVILERKPQAEWL